MERKSSLVVGLLLALMLIFAGCSTDTGDSKESGLFKKDSGTSSSGSGVDLSFAENNPPSSMIKGQPSTFAFVFTSYQEHEISDMRVKTKNFDTSYVTGLSADYTVSKIPRYSEKTGPGVFSGLIAEGVRVDNFEGNYNFNPVFDYCYSAKTSFREQICVPSKRNQCDTSIEKAKSENGPVGVSIERITAVEAGIRIDFVINNKGKGKVVNECFKTEDYANAYGLKVTLGTAQGTCEAISGQNIINGKSNFYCNFPRTSDESYASQVVVELDYNYQQEARKSIRVEDLNQGYD
jgi:hypothetical protein